MEKCEGELGKEKAKRSWKKIGMKKLIRIQGGEGLQIKDGERGHKSRTERRGNRPQRWEKKY